MKNTIFLLLFLLPVLVCAAPLLENDSIPKWVKEDWTMQTLGNGVWTTDNTKYKGEQEPFEAYGMKWEWGIGQSFIKGKLYCILDGKDAGTAWEFLSFWDPSQQEYRMIQIGGDGTVGQANIQRQEDGSLKYSQKYSSPSGGGFQTGHHIWFENGQMHTQSFDIVDEKWEKRRYYVWKQSDKS